MQSNKRIKIVRRYRFRGKVANWMGNRVCVSQPIIVGSGKLFRDHVWVRWENGFAIPEIYTEVEFSAKVETYTKTLENGKKRHQLGLIDCRVIKQETT